MTNTIPPSLLLHPAIQALTALQAVLTGQEGALDQAIEAAANLQVWRENEANRLIADEPALTALAHNWFQYSPKKPAEYLYFAEQVLVEKSNHIGAVISARKLAFALRQLGFTPTQSTQMIS